MLILYIGTTSLTRDNTFKSMGLAQTKCKVSVSLSFDFKVFEISLCYSSRAKALDDNTSVDFLLRLCLSIDIKLTLNIDFLYINVLNIFL